ncbi:MAG: class I SAM-dependent methyltransferase, partial [Candidatus Methanoperedens sp.]|nr:class I SAM-dependent methyltransferase [Candidatus Methanoperedens sp.]
MLEMKTGFRKSYHINPRPDISALVPFGTEKVLDVGCSAGELGKYLKENKGIKEVIGIEFNKEAAEIAAKCIDKVITGDVEKIDLQFETEYFDCIIYADILEHLIDPWITLEKQNKILKKNGIIIVSLPNIRYFYTFLNLILGKWEYTDRGIFDRTHLRFFTLKSIIKLLINASYNVIT